MVLVPTLVIIALVGVSAEIGVVMLVYRDEAYDRRAREGRMATVHDVRSQSIPAVDRQLDVFSHHIGQSEHP